MCHVSVMGVWLTPISSRARRSEWDVGNGVSVQKGVIEMGREFWFHSKKLGLSHIGSIFRPQVSRKERAVVVISCSYCWKCPPSRVSAGVVDTPRLQPSLPAQIRSGNYQLVINSMSGNNGISLKHLSHCEGSRNILSKAQSFGATNRLGVCVVLLPSGMVAGIWEHVSRWHRVGLPVRANPDQILQGSPTFYCCWPWCWSLLLYIVYCRFKQMVQ